MKGITKVNADERVVEQRTVEKVSGIDVVIGSAIDKRSWTGRNDPGSR